MLAPIGHSIRMRESVSNRLLFRNSAWKHGSGLLRFLERRNGASFLGERASSGSGALPLYEGPVGDGGSFRILAV